MTGTRNDTPEEDHVKAPEAAEIENAEVIQRQHKTEDQEGMSTGPVIINR